MVVILNQGSAALWPAVAAAAGALGGAALSALATFKVTKRQASQERERADTDRHQTRLLEAYTGIMLYVRSWTRLIERRQREMLAPRDPPEAPPGEGGIDYNAEALVSLVASGAVGALVQRLNKCLGEYNWAVHAHTGAQGRVTSFPRDQGTVANEQEMRQAVEDAAQKALHVMDDLTEKMRHELGAEGDLPRTTGGAAGESTT